MFIYRQLKKLFEWICDLTYKSVVRTIKTPKNTIIIFEKKCPISIENVDYGAKLPPIIHNYFYDGSK